MGTKVIEYVDTSQLYATNYIRNSKAIAVLWAIFTICYSIIVVVSFVTPGKRRDLHEIFCKSLSRVSRSIRDIFFFSPLSFAEWVGDLESETGGRIGLWKVCERNEMSDHCVGRLEDMMDMPSMSFQVNLIKNPLN